MQGQCKEVKPN